LGDTEVTFRFYRHSSLTRPGSNLKRNTNKFIKTSITSVKSKKLNNQLSEREENHFLTKRSCKSLPLQIKTLESSNILRNLKILSAMIYKKKVQAVEAFLPLILRYKNIEVT